MRLELVVNLVVSPVKAQEENPLKAVKVVEAMENHLKAAKAATQEKAIQEKAVTLVTLEIQEIQAVMIAKKPKSHSKIVPKQREMP